MTPYPAFVKGRPPEEGYWICRAEEPEGWRSHRPLTYVGNKSGRGPEVKDTPYTSARNDALAVSIVRSISSGVWVKDTNHAS